MTLHHLPDIINALWALNLLVRPALAFARFYLTKSAIMTLAENGTDEVKVEAIRALVTVHGDARTFSGFRKSAPAPGAQSMPAPAAPSLAAAPPPREPP